MDGWKTGEVCSFLEEAGVSQETVALFREARVDGVQLRAHDDISLRSFGVRDSDERVVISTAIESCILDVVAFSAPTMCDQHSHPFTVFSCQECMVRICDECAASLHEGHKFVLTKTLIKDLRQNLTVRLDQCAKVTVEPGLVDVNRMIRQVECNRELIRDHVSVEHDIFLRESDKKRNQLIAEIEMSATQSISELSSVANAWCEWVSARDSLVREIASYDDDGILREALRLNLQAEELMGLARTNDEIRNTTIFQPLFFDRISLKELMDVPLTMNGD